MAKLCVSAQCIVEALNLPRDTRITGGIYNSQYGYFELIVDHDTIPTGTDQVLAICRRIECHFEPVARKAPA